MSHLTTSSALGARPALARAPVLATSRLSAASWLAIAFFAGALLFGAVALAMGDVFYLRLATEALIFGGLALSVDLLLGRVGLLPLGQALFFGLGAYVSALVLKHWADSLWLALGVALVFSALAGLIGGLIAIRSKGVYFLAQVVSKFVYNTRELGASDGIIGVPAASLAPGVTSGTPEVFFLLVLAFIGALYLGLRYLMNTPMGRQLDAIRINEHRVSFLGVDAWRYKLGAFVAAACIAGLSGALYPMFAGADVLPGFGQRGHQRHRRRHRHTDRAAVRLGHPDRAALRGRLFHGAPPHRHWRDVRGGGDRHAARPDRLHHPVAAALA